MTNQIELRLTLTIDAPPGVSVDVDVARVDESRPSEGAPGLQAVLAAMDDQAPRSTSAFQKDYVLRCADELGVIAAPPDGKRQSYANLFPPRRYGARRAASFLFSSARVEVYCRPSDAEGRRHAEVLENNGEPFAVKLYLNSADAVQEAVELTRLGLEERDV